MFGADLVKYCERKKTLVPQFLVHFMEHIESVGLDTVGLYRLSGNAASVQKLRCLVEQGTYMEPLSGTICSCMCMHVHVYT